MTVNVFYDVKLRRWEINYQCLGAAYFLHLQEELKEDFMGYEMMAS